VKKRRKVHSKKQATARNKMFKNANATRQASSMKRGVGVQVQGKDSQSEKGEDARYATVNQKKDYHLPQ